MPDDGLGSELTPGSPQPAVERIERGRRLYRDLHCPVSLHGREVYYISADASTGLSENQAPEQENWNAADAWLNSRGSHRGGRGLE